VLLERLGEDAAMEAEHGGGHGAETPDDDHGPLEGRPRAEHRLLIA